jgi:hypothetical protein
LTTGIVDQWSCGPGSLVLKLKLSIRNTGGGPVILSRTVLFGNIMVSRDAEAAAARKYELSYRYSDFSSDPDFGLNPPELSGFVVLRPGEVYEPAAEEVSIPTYWPALTGSKPRPAVNLQDGTHYLRIGIGTWPYIAESGPFRRAWKAKGVLWSQGLLSEPMPFAVNQKQPAVNCSDRSKRSM